MKIMIMMIMMMILNNLVDGDSDERYGNYHYDEFIVFKQMARIINGRAVRAGQWPWQADILFQLVSK